MLGGPQHVEAELVHELGDVARGEEGFRQPLVGIAPLVGRRAVQAHIVELDLADIEDMEFLDHVFFPGLFMAPTISEAFDDRHAVISSLATDQGRFLGAVIEHSGGGFVGEIIAIPPGSGTPCAARDCLAGMPGKRRYSGRLGNRSGKVGGVAIRWYRGA